MSYCHVQDAVAVDAYGIRYYIELDENGKYLVWADGPGCHLGTLKDNFKTEQETLDWIDKEVQRVI
tara:strand:+ start:68 stop:265 length:198 start_codon:yes stop_codon:yes gene_type:complete